MTEGAQVSTQTEITSSQGNQNLMRSDENYNYDMPVNGQALPPEYLDVHIGQGSNPDSVISSSTGEPQVQ